MSAHASHMMLKSLDRLTFQRGDRELVEQYLSKGKNVNARDQQGWTPLMHAASKGHLEICHLLLQHGAEKSIRDELGFSVLDIAKKEGHLDIYEIIDSFLIETTSVIREKPDSEHEIDFFGDWTPEDEVPVPADSPEIRHRLLEFNDSIAAHRAVNRDEDWSHLEVDLPDAKALAHVKDFFKDGVQDILATLLEEARQYGIFKTGRVEAVAREVDGVPDGESFAHLTQMLEDLGAIHEENEDGWMPGALAEDLAQPDEDQEEYEQYLNDLSSQINDPYFHLTREVRLSVLLNREGEERIGRLIALALKDAARAIVRDEEAMKALFELEEDIKSDSWLANRICRSNTDQQETVPVLPDADEDDGPVAEDTLFAGKAVSMLAHVRFVWLSCKSPESGNASPHDLLDAMERLGLSALGIRRVQRKLLEVGKENGHLTEAIERISRLENEMFMANVRLAISVAEQYKWSKLSRMDRIQEAYIGLLRAIEKFDFSKGYKFSTYATWWLKQAVTRAIADQSRLIRLPVHIVEKVNKLSRAARRAGADSPKSMRIHDLSASSGLTDAEIRKLLPATEDACLWNDSEADHVTAMNYEDEAADPISHAENMSLRKYIRTCISRLSPREADILSHRFGLEDGVEKTLEEVGQIYDVTRERIRQIEAKAIRRLRHPDLKLEQLNQLIGD